MLNGNKLKMMVVVLLVTALLFGALIVPLQSAFAYNANGSVAVARGSYYDLPEKVSSYVSSGKTLEFDLNIQISDTDVCKLGLYDGSTFVSSEFLLKDGADGLNMIVEPIDDG